MKAVWYERNGAAREVLVTGEMARPEPQAGEVLVRLHASGVNPSDVKARAGARPMTFDRVIPHSDGAGFVEAVGSVGLGIGIGERCVGEVVELTIVEQNEPAPFGARWSGLRTKSSSKRIK